MLYAPLNPRLKEIRVLQLAPGSYDDELEISLRIERLEGERPEYNALSYAWGTERCPRKAVVNGQQVSIGRNLDSALRDLRHSMVGHWLWADALCINQEDLIERSEQVRDMRYIYESAEEVMIWLNKEHPNDQFVIDSIKKKRMPTTTDEAIFLLRALKRVCLRPWFGRVWVAQEMAVAKRSPIICLGHRTVRWDCFSDYIMVLSETFTDREKGGEWPAFSLLRFQQAKDRVQMLQLIRRWTSIRYASLLILLDHTKNLRATDPRDKVYALLGLCSSAPYQTARMPDYSEFNNLDYRKSVQRVFVEASRFLISNNGFPYSILPLREPPGMRSSVTRITLPSWAFNFTFHAHHHNDDDVRNDPEHFYHDARNLERLSWKLSMLPECSRVSEDLKRLHTIGLHIGTVVATSEDLFHSSHPNRKRWPDFPATNVCAFYDEVLKPRNVPPSAYLEAFNFKSRRDVDLEIFETLLDKRMHLPVDLEDPQDVRFWRECFTVLFHLSDHDDVVVFVTEEGHIGTLYHPEPLTAVQPGDVVVGLFGLNCPFVLRPIVGRTGSRQKYIMINVAHVVGHDVYGHDFLNDAGPRAKWKDFEKFGLRKYIIV